MQNTEEHLASLRAGLNREPPPYPDLREENARLQSANENLQHRVLCLSHENRGLYAKLELLRGAEGDRHHDGNSFASSSQQSADESPNVQVEEPPKQPEERWRSQG